MPGFVSQPRGWLRAHPLIADGLLGLALAVACVWAARAAWAELVDQARDYPPLLKDTRPPDLFSAGLDLLASLPLMFRRRYPLSVGICATAGVVVSTAAGYPSLTLFSGLFAAYAVGAYSGLARGAVWVAATGAGLIVAQLVNGGDSDMSNIVLNPLVVAVAWWVGRNMLLRRAYTAELESRARRLERARDVYARAALTEERARIARELHDVVAHHVSVMTVQASAAKRVLDRDPDRAREALTAVESTGRSALAEMRRIVGVLRAHDDGDDPGHPAERGPQPGIADIAELVRQTREAGLNVVLRTEGAPRALAAGADLAAYRVVQEALTNTLKHAGTSVRARVTVRFTAQEVTVRVDDDGPDGAPPEEAASELPGHGLVGMRERVALYGGDLRAGPRTGGGYGVSARFPVEETAEALTERGSR